MKPQSVEQLLQAMVAFNTVNAYLTKAAAPERALAEYLETQAQSLGLTTQRLPVSNESFNLLLTHQVSAAAPWLLFESHMDTVSVEGMTVAPFAGEIKDGYLYGRGACDTKGTGAAMLWALQEYLAASEQPNNIALVYTVDEEVGKTGVRTFVERHLPHLAWRPAGVIIGEPTQLQPVVAHNGVVRWRIETHGLAAHSSNPTNGRSAISMMAKVIEAIESHYIPNLTTFHPLTGPAQCSINIIRGGLQINIIPDQCEIHVDRRIVPGEDPHTVLPAVEQILANLRQTDPVMQVSQQEPDHLDWSLDPAGGEALAAFVQAVLGKMALPTELVGVGYGTDGSNFGRVGMPTLVLGPGSIAQAHTKDEWLDLAQLKQGVEVYRALMGTPLER